MKRYLPVLILLLILGVYLFAFGWAGFNFASYARGSLQLSLEKIAPRQTRLDEKVTLSLAGEGFDDETRVTMHLDVNNQDAVVGTFPVDNIIHDMEIIDKKLILAVNKNGLKVFDISDPLKPKMIPTHIGSNITVIDIESQGDTLYLSCGVQGLKIAQIGGKSGFINWKNLKTWSAAIASRVVGHFLYVAAGKGGLLVYDLDNIDDGQPLAVISSDHRVLGLAVFGNYLYDVSGPGGINIYKIDDSGLPLLTGQLSFDLPVRSISIADGSLYVLERGRVSQYSLAEPESPRLVAEQPHFSMPHRLHYAGDRIYVSDNESGLGLIDNSEKLLPETASFFHLGGNSRALTTVGQYLYVAVSNFGIKIVDPQAILPRQVTRTLKTSKAVRAFLIHGDYLYVADDNDKFFVKSLSEKSSSFKPFASALSRSMTISGNLLYIASQTSGIEVYSLENPAAPELVAKWPELKMHLAAVDGNYLVGSLGAAGLKLIRLAGLDTPKILDTVPEIVVSGLFVKDDLVVVAGGRAGLMIYRIKEDGLIFLSQLALPFPLDQFSSATQVQVVGDLAYVANGESGLMLVDISAPEEPYILSSLNLPGYVTSLRVDGDRAYVISRYSGLHTVDVSDLHSPILLSSVNISDLYGAPQRYKELLYLGNRYMGVTAIPPPRELEAVSVLSSGVLQVTIPPPAFPGRYSLQVSNGEGTASLAGVLRYQ